MLEDLRRAGDAAAHRQRAADEAAAREKAQESLNKLNLSAPQYSVAPHNYPPPQQVSPHLLFPACASCLTAAGQPYGSRAEPLQEKHHKASHVSLDDIQSLPISFHAIC